MLGSWSEHSQLKEQIKNIFKFPPDQFPLLAAPRKAQKRTKGGLFWL